ncbi:MAG: hypothetical protein PHI32_03940 [Dysgonamonadaceae bacterium]|nr:hypothetical protein [Dysgonamonadaceae bacterium]
MPFYTRFTALTPNDSTAIQGFAIGLNYAGLTRPQKTISNHKMSFSSFCPMKNWVGSQIDTRFEKLANREAYVYAFM